MNVLQDDIDDNDDYECALTAMTAAAGTEDDSDGLGDMPVGWTRIHIVRRAYNPAWLEIQETKRDLIQALLSQLPGDAPTSAATSIRVQVSATFHQLEKDTPMYLPDIDDEVFVSDTKDEAVIKAINDLRGTLGLDPVPEDDEDATGLAEVVGDDPEDDTGDDDSDETGGDE